MMTMQKLEQKLQMCRPETGSALPVLQFHFADADLSISL